jgi:hypothetical protein
VKRNGNLSGERLQCATLAPGSAEKIIRNYFHQVDAIEI